MKRIIDESVLPYIAIGAAVLGAGGGGAPRVGKLLAMSAIRQHGPVEVWTPDEVPDEAWVTTVSCMGAPLCIMEKLFNGDEFVRVFRMKEEAMNKKFIAVSAVEAGGINSMIPLALAAELRIPMVDADGIGRAFPELPMTTYHAYGLKADPFVMTDEKNNEVVLRAVDNYWGETIGRAITNVMGGSSTISSYVHSGKDLKAYGIWGSLQKCEDIGRIILRSTETDKTPVDALLEYCNGIKLFKGKITDVERVTRGGFNRGSATIEGIEECNGQIALVEFQNENIFATVNGEPIGFTPDLLDFIDIDSAMPIEATDYRYGQRGYLVGLPCDPKWRTPEALQHVNPRAFHYDYDYIPIEELAARRAL